MVYQAWQLLCLACCLNYTKMKRSQEIQWMKRYVKQENNTCMIYFGKRWIERNNLGLPCINFLMWIIKCKLYHFKFTIYNTVFVFFSFTHHLWIKPLDFLGMWKGDMVWFVHFWLVLAFNRWLLKKNSCYRMNVWLTCLQLNTMS